VESFLALDLSNHIVELVSVDAREAPQLGLPTADQLGEIVLDSALVSELPRVLAQQDPSRTGCDEVGDVVVRPTHRILGPSWDTIAQLELTAAVFRTKLDQIGDASRFRR
jgi:hypothetical protein